MPLELSSSDLSSPFADSIIALRNGLMHDLKAYPLSDQPTLRLSEIKDKQWKLSLLHATDPLEQSCSRPQRSTGDRLYLKWRFPNVFIHHRPGFDIVCATPIYE